MPIISVTLINAQQVYLKSLATISMPFFKVAKYIYS